MLHFTLQKQCRRTYQPKRIDINSWIRKSLVKNYAMISIDCTIVSSQVSRQYNKQYRDIDYPTNVISLEYGSTRDEYAILCGELILCDDVIVNEAQGGGKNILEHYAHMVIHGLLHLQGFEHESESGAQQMEQLEAKIMQQLGFSDPYLNLVKD